MKNDIKISVLVPIYNTKTYLRECIESILNQTYQNFELILMDDGSTDGSGEVCDEYLATNSKIVVVHKENQGLVLTRRASIKLATGDYLMFLDSDDCLRSDALELISKSVDQFGCDLIFFNASKKSGFISRDWDMGLKDKQIFEKADKNLLYEKIITTSQLNNLCFKAVKRTLIDIEKDYKEFAVVTSTEDLLQSLPIIDSCEKALYLDEALYFYRQHGSSMVHNFTHKSYESIKTVHRVLLQYLYKWNMQECIQKYYARRISVVLKYSQGIILGRQQKKEKIKALEELAKDEYFIEAFLNLDKSTLKKRKLKLINNLFSKKVKKFYFTVISAYRAHRILRLIGIKR